MLFTTNNREHFTRQDFTRPWKRKFAIIPTLVAVRDGKKVYAWLQYYESRKINYLCWQRRSMVTGDTPVIVDYGDLADAC